MTTDINKRILQAIETNKNIKLIEVSKIAVRDVRVEVLDKLEEKNIELLITDNLKPLQMYTHKTDCFAYRDKQCSALTDINCENCRFYKHKSEVNSWEIENAIKKYSK